jgi:tetratricopeptide (TPR) repeat protein
MRATLQSQLDHYAEAVADLGVALGKHEDPDSRNLRCWYRAIWGRQLQEALYDCNRALDASPNQPAFLDSRGLVQFRLGNYQAAVADYDAALKLRPDAPTSLYVRGIARKRLGVEGGDQDIATALARSPGVAKDFDRMGIRP